MDLVTCKCANCDAKLGCVDNLWTQIGKKYLTSATHAEDQEQFRISTSGSIRQGDADTLVGGCQLQDAECAKCRINLGQKCLTTSMNHAFNDGQIIFRISSITLKSSSDLRRSAEPKIKRVLKLRNDTPSTDGHGNTSPAQEKPFVNSNDAGKCTPQDSPSVDNLDFMQLQADLDAQRVDIHRIGSTGMQVVSNFETAIARVERQMKQLGDSIDSVRKDSDGQRGDLRSLKSEVTDVRWGCENNSVVSRLDQQLQTTDRVVTELRQALNKFKPEMADLRGQLAAAQQDLHEARDETARLKNEADETKPIAHESVAVSKQYAFEVSTLRREIKQLRGELAQERAQQRSSEFSSFSSHELDILASSISKIGNRASQVESLQMEFELFRTRVQRLEARASMSAATPNRGCATINGGVSPQNDENTQPYCENNIRKKRTSAGRDDAQNFDTTPPKRVALSSSEFGSGLSATYARSSDLYRSSPGTSGVVAPSGTRRTRASGAGGRNTTKRGWEAGS
ncbi:hypothetical protein TOPH_05144 [Tolypocladium ophioglossoides CBS 100239]|uniref:Uncharacterized protein n=1 Tax=Tolypocladium ophioglossoides (strain CBS 100239) TaxID=1163406 RepID=A0A0L0N7Z6_TOLOC|nr:hypothetical protein TOPH_05144 [Tolypocladium ophioglossoides CBS 100239]